MTVIFHCSFSLVILVYSHSPYTQIFPIVLSRLLTCILTITYLYRVTSTSPVLSGVVKFHSNSILLEGQRLPPNIW